MTAPVQQPKVNLHYLLRQVQTQKEQEDFFIKNDLLPKNIECPKCKDNLTQVYPLSNPAEKFKYFKCSCSPREKIPATKDTMMYQSKLSLPMHLVLLCGFCYRWKYSDVKRVADLEGPDKPGQPGYTEKILNDNTVANCTCVLGKIRLTETQDWGGWSGSRN